MNYPRIQNQGRSGGHHQKNKPAEAPIFINFVEKYENLLLTFAKLQETVVTTIQFYVDNGDIVSGVFMLMIFYNQVIAYDPYKD